MMPASSPRLSIVVLTYNRVDLTVRLLDSLRDTAPPDAELLLVDNASHDGTREVVSAFARARPRTTAICLDENQGYSRGNNQAAGRAVGRYLVFLNQDMVAVPGCFDVYAQTLAEPCVGIAGIKLLFPNGRIQHAGVDLRFPGCPVHRHVGVEDGEDGERDPMDVAAITGACLGISRELFTRLGGFDERCQLLYQDVDLCFKAVAVGLAVRYHPAARMVHVESASSRDLRTESLVSGDWSLLTGRWGRALGLAEEVFIEKLRPTVGRRPLVVYGTGRMAELAAGTLQRCGVPVEAFADTHAVGRTDSFAARPVIGPADIPRIADAAVLIASTFAAEIEARLRGVGFRGPIVDSTLPTSLVYDLLRRSAT